MRKHIHFPCDELYQKIVISWKKSTHTRGKVGAAISQVLPIRWVLLHTATTTTTTTTITTTAAATTTTTTTTTTTATTATTTTTTTTTTTIITTTKEIYFCSSLIIYHIFRSITLCVKNMDITNSASALQV